MNPFRYSGAPFIPKVRIPYKVTYLDINGVKKTQAVMAVNSNDAIIHMKEYSRIISVTKI